MTEFQVYWWLKLDGIIQLGTALSCILLLTTCLIIFGWVDEGDEVDEKMNKLYRTLLTIFSLLLVLTVIATKLIPSTKEYAIIKVLPVVSNSQLLGDIKKDIPHVYELAKEALKEKLKGVK